MDKLTEHELLKRLDNEFYDVDFQFVTCIEENEDE